MKRFLSLALCLILACGALVLSGCGEKQNEPDTTLKFGAGVYVSTPATTDATADKEGTGKVDITFAAVSVDADGKVVACALDTASNTVKFTADGKALANESFSTKYELGDSYSMVAYGGAKQEWYKQADAFAAVVKGKTLAEIKALVAEGQKGNDEVLNAGCTIMISEFVNAIDKAFAALADSDVTADNTLKVTAYTEQTCTDAIEDKDGTNKVSTTVFAAAVDADGKVVASKSDCVEVTFSFDTLGVSTLDTSKAVASKREQGTAYGMVAYGGSAKEWFEQADAFDAACVGKTASEITGLMAEDGRGTDSLKAAGCTVYVTGFVKAASKI